jgi:probable rRNA maturation factor
MSAGQARITLPEIDVRNFQRAVAVNVGSLEKFAQRALRLCLRLRRPKPTDLVRLRAVSILIISDRRMATLHREFLHQSGPTDVLTFQHGEIFISAETARRHARRFGTSLARELRLYVVHGLLHLHGFDDRNEIEARKMAALQERILKRAVV